MRRGDAPVALIVPKGFGERPIAFGPGAAPPKVTILADSADPIAPQVLGGLIQKVVMTSMPQSMARAGMDEVDKWSGGLTPEQKAKMEEALRSIGAPAAPRAAGAGRRRRLHAASSPSRHGTSSGESKSNPTVAFYAAGFGVMFLLFSAAGAGGALIEEAESGTLDRILSTKVDMTRLLLGKLLYLATIAVAQLTLMFVWGALVFGVDLWNHIPGFVVMTVATALACSTFGLMLAALSRSRMQLVAISNLAILLMSALGGSHVPAVSHAREDAEGGPSDAQRLGHRRFPEDLLAGRAGLERLAAGRCARRAWDRFLPHRPQARPALADGLTVLPYVAGYSNIRSLTVSLST